MFQIAAFIILAATIPSSALMLNAPKSLFLFVVLVVIGLLLLGGGVILYHYIMRNPGTGAGSSAGNPIIGLFGIALGSLGCVLLISATILGWRIFG